MVLVSTKSSTRNGISKLTICIDGVCNEYNGISNASVRTKCVNGVCTITLTPK